MKSTTVNHMVKDAHNSDVQEMCNLLKREFVSYVQNYKPKNPGTLHVVNWNDICFLHAYDYKKKEKYLNKNYKPWTDVMPDAHKGCGTLFSGHTSIVTDIMDKWAEIFPDENIEIKFEVVSFETKLFFFFKDTIQLPMWKIQWL